VAKRSARILAALILVPITLAAHRALPSPTRAERGERFVPRPQAARLAALGFDALVADFYWLQAVQVVGGARFDPSQHATLLAGLIDVTTTLDPWVDHPYRFAAVWLTDSPENVRRANRLLERGIAYHPRDWRNRFYLGFNHFFYLDESTPAADAIAGAIDLPGAPRHLRRLVARLRAESAGLETAAAFLGQLAASTPDPYARAEYEKALDEIQTERLARVLDRAREEYRRRVGRDLEALEELVRGPQAVLRTLPPEPHGWEWSIDSESGRIVSSYYGHRYEPQIHPTDQKRRAEWLAERAPEAEVGE
jgi:hypothetical protein